MIQFNLLPDLKLEYIRAQRTRRLVISAAFLITSVSVGIFCLLLGANAVQKKHSNDLSSDIVANSIKLKNKPDIGKILTVQNQLNTLTTLHDQKPAVSRVFDDLNQLTPATVAINNFSIDLSQQAITITGTATAISSVNQYADTLKLTTYTDGSTKGTKPFTNVVLGSFGLSDAATGSKPVSYSLTLSYDPTIFDITKDITLAIPSAIVTGATLGGGN